MAIWTKGFRRGFVISRGLNAKEVNLESRILTKPSSWCWMTAGLLPPFFVFVIGLCLDGTGLGASWNGIAATPEPNQEGSRSGESQTMIENQSRWCEVEGSKVHYLIEGPEGGKP